ncbi:MAG: hypothetical protein WCG01_02950 [bacterium]
MLSLNNNKGSMLIIVLVASSLLIVILVGAISSANLQLKLNLQKVSNAQALHIAEAGINYYRWVLYHNNFDFCNSETCKPGPNYGPYGPYSYKNDTGQVIGYYELYITPPESNKAQNVKIKATGWTVRDPRIKRSIEVVAGLTSWASYNVISNGFFRTLTNYTGKVHGNSGISFQGYGKSNSEVSSTLTEFNDPDHGNALVIFSGNTATDKLEYGIHYDDDKDLFDHPLGIPLDPFVDGTCAAGRTCTPEFQPTRADVFPKGRVLGAPAIGFDLLNLHVSNALILASTSGVVLEPSGVKGYHLTIIPNPTATDTIAVRKVNKEFGDCGFDGTAKSCQSIRHDAGAEDPPFYITIPTNGIVFVKDKIWIDGTINNDRVTVYAFGGSLSGNTTDIITNNDLRITSSSTDKIGLIAQRSILVGYESADNLTIDADLIAKNGYLRRDCYSLAYAKAAANNAANNGGIGLNWTYLGRNSITINGSNATSGRGAYSCTSGSYYTNTYQNFDDNMANNPPPNFPTTGNYKFLSWREL